MRFGFRLLLATGTVLILLGGAWLLPRDVVRPAWAQSTGVPAAAVYPGAGLHKGVWADGQAAFWDFNLFDHFHYFGPEERARGYQPTQPIPFSHVTHVQKAQMECQFCHWNVAKSPFASIPEVEVCYGCHKQLVMGSDEARKKSIQQVNQYYTDNRPIPWVKVHVTPDYVRFNHKRHVKGGVACHECHGGIPEMEVVERVSSMKMGWCVSCHRERGGSIDCLVCHK